jgi:polysaccharide export outer membrane protein
MRLGTAEQVQQCLPASRLVMLATALAAAVLLAACGGSLSSPELGGATAALGAEPGESGFESPAAKVTPAGLSGSAAGDPARTAAAKAASSLTASSSPGNAGYKIGPQDVLDINVFQVAELSRAAQVSESGTISMPLIGPVPASGRTAQELERDLASRYLKYLQKPQIAVMVKEYNAQRITLEGSVKKPGVYPLRGRTTLLQTIAQAEGFSDVADTTVVVFRQTQNGQSAARFDVAAIRAGTAEDPTLQAGDVIVVGTSTLKETMQGIMKFLPLASVFALL